jgi:hypothetical protein
MADAPDLGSGPERGGGSNPLVRTSRGTVRVCCCVLCVCVLLPTNDNLYIGAYRGSCDLRFTGDVDEVQVFGRALFSTEVWVSITRVTKVCSGRPPIAAASRNRGD